MMRLNEAFDLQIDTEGKVQKIYKKFAERFAYWEEASLLWKAMAREEYGHLAALRWARRLMDLGARSRPCVSCGEGGGALKACTCSRGPGESGKKGEVVVHCDEKVISEDRESVRLSLEVAGSRELTEETAVYITSMLEALEMNKLGQSLLSLPENATFRDIVRHTVIDRSKESKHLNNLLRFFREHVRRIAV